MVPEGPVSLAGVRGHSRKRFCCRVGVVGLGLVAVLLLLRLPSWRAARERMYQINRAGNLKTIGLALLMYSGEFSGQFPESLGPLNVNDYLVDGKVYGCPSQVSLTTTASSSSYIYLGKGALDWCAAKQHHVIAYCQHGRSWTNIVFVDGHVEGAPGTYTAWKQRENLIGQTTPGHRCRE